jgi:hypothetical protein
MNDKQFDKIEGALMGALEFLQVHAPEAGPETVYDRVLDDLRSAHALIRAWRAMVRASACQDAIPVLPGQMSMPGMPPEKKS